MGFGIYHWTGFYYVIPEWEGPRGWPKYLNTPEEARLILAFDEYIPQILGRAQELVLKHREQETACEIIKAPAEGLINALLSEGRISLRREAEIYCSAPNRIEVILDDATKWLCLSLDELKGLLLGDMAPNRRSKYNERPALPTFHYLALNMPIFSVGRGSNSKCYPT